MNRRLRQLWPARWWQFLARAAAGARVHPSATLLGASSRTLIGRGSSIGARSRLDPGSKGRIVVGAGVWISSDVEIETSTCVQIGDGTTVQRRCSFNGSTRIGRGCIFAPNVFVSSGTHPFRTQPHLPIREQERRLGPEVAALDRPVWIQDDCWLGVNAVICPGVTVGKGSIVGAGAVVTHDVPPYCVVAGSPARSIGSRLDWLPPATLDFADERDWVYVVSGTPGRAGDGRTALAVHASAPARVVLAADDARRGVLRVELEVATHAELVVAGVVRTISSGQQCLHFPIASLELGMGGVPVDICAPDVERSSPVKVSRLAIEAA